MGDLAPLVTAGGGLGAVVMVILYLLSSNRQDRKEYQEAIDKAEARADRADARAGGLEAALDEARARRRTAEDQRDEAKRELARYRPDPGRPP